MLTRKRLRGADLDERQRWAFIAMTLWHENPPKEMKKLDICELFEISERTGRRIMEEYKESIENDNLIPD
jgi:hypothetical protein